jgi:hypothetical protein
MEDLPDTNKKYMLAYYYPAGTRNLKFIELNADNIKDATRISKCVFGPSGLRHLYFKEIKK